MPQERFVKWPLRRFKIAAKSATSGGGVNRIANPSGLRHGTRSISMSGPPPRTHSFVVRVWSKRVEEAEEDASWRGSITHVETGERLYLEGLTEVPAFIAPYIVEAGGTLDFRTRLCVWMASLASHNTACD